MHKNAGRRKGFGRQWWRRRLQLEHELRTRLLALLSALAALIKTVSRHKKLITANNFRIKTFQFSFFSLVSRISLFLVVVVVFLLVPFLVAYSHCRFFFAAKKKEELLLLRSRLRRTSLARGAFCFSHSCCCCCCSYSCCCCYLKRLRVGASAAWRVFYADGLLCCLPDCLFVFLFFAFVFVLRPKRAAVAPAMERPLPWSVFVFHYNMLLLLPSSSSCT